MTRLVPSNWQEVTSAADYEGYCPIHHLRQGDTYQVNYTSTTKSRLKCQSFAIYNRMVVVGGGLQSYVEHDGMASDFHGPELFVEASSRELTATNEGTTRRE